MKSRNHLFQCLVCAITLALCIGCGHEHGPHTHTHGPSERGDGHSHYRSDGDRPPFTYLAMNGEFHLNPGDSMSQNDPRNPGRLILKTSAEKGSLTRMTFFDHSDLQKQLAACGYHFIGSRPDPHYYPERSKTSIWDVFEQVEEFSGDCIKYKYVLSRSPHGDPIHMHLRYGNNVDSILELSNAPYDSEYNPWWATYCDIERTRACD